MTRELSIVVVSRRPSLALARMLRTLGRARGVESAELLLGLDGWECGSALVRGLRRWLPRTRTHVVALARATPAHNRNELVARARGAVVVFLDDDVEVPDGFLLAARRALADASVAVAGGPNVTPAGASRFQRLAGRILASRVGAGPVRNRYRVQRSCVHADERRLMLCNLVVRRDALGAAPFDPELRCAEENELLRRLARRGATMVSTPELTVHHQRRGRLSAHARQMAKYGFGRGQVLVRTFYGRQATYGVPAAALVLLGAGLVVAPYVALGALAAYGVVVVTAAVALGSRDAPRAAGLIVATHVPYALGVLAGVGYEAQRLERRVLRASRGRFGPDAVAMLAPLGLVAGAALATTVAAARTLGPEGRGTFELAWTGAAVVAALALFRIAHGRTRRRRTPSPAQLAILGVVGVHLRLDVVVLALLRGAGPLGEYAAAVGLAAPLAYGGLAVALALHPRSTSVAGGAVRTVRAFRAVLWLTGAGAVAVWLASGRLVVQLFGAEFAMARWPLHALLPGSVALAALLVLAGDLTGRGRGVAVAATGLGILLADLALDLVLVPRFGVRGAAVAATASCWMGTGVLLGLFSRTTGVPIVRCVIPRPRDARAVAAAVFGRRRDALVAR